MTARVTNRTTERARKLGNLVKERSLNTTGFRSAMKQLVKEFAGREDLEFIFEDWFVDINLVPAAFNIERDRDRHGIWSVTVHVYELELSPLPTWKFQQYGIWADGNGPQIDLHVIDRCGVEDVFECQFLMCLAFKEDREIADSVRSYRAACRKAQLVPDKPTVRKWKAAYDAVREMGVKI